MKIIELQADNFMKLKAVQITPDGNVVEVRGANAQGKTSVLRAIWSALGGADAEPDVPIRRGAETARIRLNLGDIIVTKRFTPSNSSLVVEAASGARFPSPQRMLDDLVGAIAFDPLEFTRMRPKDQLDALRRLVKLDTDALDGQNTTDYQARTVANRDARKLRAQADGLKYPDGLPDQPIDVVAMTQHLRAAGEQNAALERQIAKRDSAKASAERHRADAKQLHVEAQKLRDRATSIDLDATKMEEDASEIDRRLVEAPPLPDPIDTTKIVAELEEARVTNAHIDTRRRREQFETEAALAEGRSAELSASIEARLAAKAAAIAAAEMPIPGLGFGDGEVLYGGLPLDQASHAEKVRVSVAIAMAANPKLRVLVVKDGSLLDRESWRALAEAVESNDFQAWVEVTDDDAKTGIVIEDGEVRQRSGEKSI